MSFSKLGAEIWRAYETDGVPASGAHKVIKSDMRDWMTSVETGVGGVNYRTADWATSTAYAVGDVIWHNSVDYRCTSAHTSGAATEPGVGGSYTTVWQEFAASVNPTGSVSAPGITFGADKDTGFYRTTANVLGVAVGGAAVARFTTTALIVGLAGSLLGTLSLSGNASGTTSLVPAAAASGVLTLPATTDTLVGRATTDTLTNKSLTAPTIAGGTHTAITSFGIRSSGSGAFDLTVANTENLTAGRTLTIVMGDAARTLTLVADATVGRTIAGTSNEVSVSNGSGAAGNPTISLPASLTFTGKTVTGGTFASPTAITGLPDPTNAQDAATKNYVDTVAQGLDAKPSVKVATTANITLSGEQTIDGVTTSTSRVLVKNQSTGSQNGIYVSSSGAWTRALDADAWTELLSAYVFVEEGTVNGDTGWTSTNNSGGTLGSTAVTFTQFAGVGSYTAGTGLSLSGTQFSIDSTVTTLTGSQTLTNKTLTAPVISSIVNTGTLSLPTTTDTLVGRATTDTLTNKSLTSAVLTGTADVQQAVKFSGTLTPTALSGAVNDYAPTNFATATALRIDGGAADRNITGIAGGADGRIIIIHNIGATNSLVMKNADASSSAANRFAVGADLTIAVDQSIALRYDGTSSRWRTLAASAAAGGGSGSVTSVATGFGLAGGTISTSGTLSISSSAPPSGVDTPINMSIACSVSANALTIAIKDQAGSDPTSSSPVLLPFRSATAATGTPAWLALTSAASLVISSGSTMGTANNVAFRLWIVGFNDAGTFRIGAINCLSGTDVYPLASWGIASSTAEGGAGAADSAHVIYTGTAATSKAYVVLGYITFESGLGTAGTWSAGPTRVQLMGADVPLPGQRIQTQRNASAAVATGSTNIPYDDTIPQNSEGDQYFSKAITPGSAANLLEIDIKAVLNSNGGSRLTMALFQDSTADALAAVVNGMNASTDLQTMALKHVMLAATTSATTMKMRAGNNASVTTTLNGENTARRMGGVMSSYLEVTEIMA